MPATYAIADLHGMADLLERMLAYINPGREDTVVCLGDYLDRGPDPLGVLRVVTLLEAAAERTQLVPLRGNHDADWLGCWDRDADQFLSYPSGLPGAWTLWEAYQGQLPPAIGHFLSGTRAFYEDSACWYSHAGARCDCPFWESTDEDYIYGSERYLTTDGSWSKPVVCGHYEVPAPYITATKVMIDTAAYRTGVLTAYNVTTREIIQVTSTDVMRRAATVAAPPSLEQE